MVMAALSLKPRPNQLKCGAWNMTSTREDTGRKEKVTEAMRAASGFYTYVDML
jgi:hypothetical protein